jgi:hypothetical protein
MFAVGLKRDKSLYFANYVDDSSNLLRNLRNFYAMGFSDISYLLLYIVSSMLLYCIDCT